EIAGDIEAVLTLAESKGKPPMTAPHTGFQRLVAERTLMLVDAAAPSALDGHAHAGALSFELSVGKERLVVNCGAHVADQSDWRRLFLSPGGGDLRGEDTLVGEGRGRYAVRFHLHPRVQASLVQDGSAVLLRLPSGLGWRLRTSTGTLVLADSIYLGRRGEMK